MSAGPAEAGARPKRASAADDIRGDPSTSVATSDGRVGVTRVGRGTGTSGEQHKGANPMAQDSDFEVVYTNLVRITHVALEFLMDFKRLGPESREVESAPTEVRVVMHPVVAKAFRDALTENVRRYEEQFGEIPAPPSGSGGVVH